MRRVWAALALAVAVAAAALIIQTAYARGAEGHAAAALGLHAAYAKGAGGHWANATACPHAGRWGWHVGWRNATLYSVSRSVSLQGQGIGLDLKVDVVTRNATAGYGAVVYGSGTLQLGGSTYAVKSAFGLLAPGGLRLMLYTDGGLVQLAYRGGRYYAVVKPFGQRGYAVYNGTAQLNIS